MPDTTTLLLRWKDGDEDAFAEIVSRHLGWLRTTVRHHIGPLLRAKIETGDAIQEAFKGFLRYGPRVNVANGDQFRRLMARIIINALRDQSDWFASRRRDMARESRLSSSCIEIGRNGRSQQPEIIAEDKELRERIRFALELMGPEDRRVILLKIWDDKKFAEIGDELRITEDAARMRFERAKIRLLELLEHLHEGDVDALLEASES